jgi:RNA polymerase sigma-70 factor (ECF subfamily)
MAWLRQPQTGIDRPKAFIATVSARLAMNRARDGRKRRAILQQPPLPVPLLGDPFAAVDAGLDLSYSVVALSQGMPALGRAVVILRDGFDLSFGEIAQALGRTPAGCRQAYRRALRMLAGQPVSQSRDDDRSTALLRRLIDLIRAGSVAELASVLAEDIVLRSDGGRSAPAIARVVQGRDRIARFLIASPAMISDDFDVEIAQGPQGPFLLISSAKAILLSVAIETAAGLITSICALSDPQKLAKIAR